MHPHAKYDTEQKTRDAIGALARTYSDEDCYVLWGERDGATYLRRDKLPQNRAHSRGGEMSADFIREILTDCKTLTICEHTGNYCHHTAFEMILGGFACSPLASLTVVLPSFAISNDEYDTGTALSESINSLRSKVVCSGWFPQKIRGYRNRFVESMSPLEMATLRVFEHYLFVACSRATGSYSLDISLGDTRVIGSIRSREKKFDLVLQNNLT